MKKTIGVRSTPAVDADVVERVRGKLVDRLGVEPSASADSFLIDLALDEALETDSYSIGYVPGGVMIRGRKRVDLLAGAGRYIRDCIAAGEVVEHGRSDICLPAIPSRIIYAPGHFRNSYEEASYEEMRDLMSEAAFWGANTWGDWFDTNETTNPYGSNLVDSRTPQQYWENKLDLLQAAQDVGLNVHIWVSPNHVFADQVSKELIAVKDLDDDVPCMGRRQVRGNLICPSKPAAREIILTNYRNLFEDMERRGIRLDFVSFGFYDNGGCLCEACRPWVDTVLGLADDIRPIALKHFPACRFDIVGWYLSEQEIERIEHRYERNQLRWADGLQIALSGGSRDVTPMASLRSIGKELFVNLGYSGDNVDDVYGLAGAVTAPKRMTQIVRSAALGGCRGIVGYGEGIHDDINKVLFSRLATQADAHARDVLVEYAGWYFGADHTDAGELAEILSEMEDGAYTSRPDLRRRLSTVAARLAPSARNSWRFQQLEYRLLLCELDAAIGRPGSWDETLVELLESGPNANAGTAQAPAARAPAGQASQASHAAPGNAVAAARGFVDGLRLRVDRRRAWYRRMNREVYGLGFFGLFEYPKRAAFYAWESEIRGLLASLPSDAGADEVITALQLARDEQVQSED